MLKKTTQCQARCMFIYLKQVLSYFNSCNKNQSHVSNVPKTDECLNSTPVLITTHKTNTPLQSFSNNENISLPNLSLKEKPEEDKSEDESFYDAVNGGGSVVDAQLVANLSINDIHFDSIEADEPPNLTTLQIESEEDSEYEEDELNLNNQKSVFADLFSQVRIGMDLTKVHLPTFILETRSLLELYADFNACTDIILQIPDFQSPHERMIQVHYIL